jgi:CheY-like chemotaxis protein
VPEDLFTKWRVNLADAQVLLLDASLQGRELLVQILNGLGIRHVTRAGAAPTAWDRLLETDYDLIICSSAAKGDDIYDFIRKVRATASAPNKFCPIIILSGHASASTTQKARDCGANIVVAKPINPRTLLERIVWIAKTTRPFIEAPGSYLGPDRRFQALGPPQGTVGRRKEDTSKSEL